MANNAIQIFDGTPSTVLVGATTTIADGIFSVGGTNATVTEFDNSTDLWPLAVATLVLPDTFLAAPDAGSTIDLYYTNNDIAGGTQDEVPPTTTLVQGAHYAGSFLCHAADIDQPMQTVISLIGIRKCNFYIQNNTGTTMSFSSGFTLKVEGFTYTPST